MMNQQTAQIKSLMEKVYSVIDDLDAKGISKHIPVCNEDGLKGLVQADMLLFLIRGTNNDEIVNDDCLTYVNECLGYSFTQLTFELAKKKAMETELPEMCLALPIFILIDKQIGGNELSSVYIQALAYVTLGYIRCEEHNSLEEMVAYYRLCSGCIQMVEKSLGEKVDFNPLSVIKEGKELELIKCAIEIDKMIHKKNPLVEAMEEALRRTLAEDKEKDVDIVEEEKKEIELFKDQGDGSELESETNAELIKDLGDGSDLQDEIVEVEPHYEEMQLTALDELDALIGLQDVKNQVRTMVNVLKVRKRCEELDVKRPAISLHMVFTGNPGTGKTTVARVLGKIYREAGLLSKGHFVEASRAELVDKYVGHTAIKVKEIFEKAKGGILFIDEAYALTSEGDSFGQEAVETLLKLMEDNRDDIAVIVAGYPALMQDFLESNPGLRSRFPFVVEFPNYSGEELTRIFKCFCEENDIVASREVLKAVNAHFENEASKKQRNFGNARAVRNYFEKMIMNQANRLVRDNLMEKEDLCRFTRGDLPNTLKIKPMQLPKQHKFTVV